MLAIGRVVERYRVEALLGEGGTATVYRVRHTTLDTLHALKVLGLAHRSVRERFITEGRVQAALRHPNAVAVQDVFEVDGVPCLLLEYVDGPDLGRWIETEPYTLEDAERVFRQIVAAVGAAHAIGLVHRDLKPANVLMERDGEVWVPKVADFGIAKVVLDGREGRTRAGVAMGTPAWMAPEQIRDASGVDRRADLFSLGCILYNLVTRRPPFDGDDVVEVYETIVRRGWTPPQDLVPDLPDRFARVVEACLRVDPGERPESCEALLDLLGEPTLPEAGAVPVDREATGPTDLPGPAAAPEPAPWFRGPAATLPPGSWHDPARGPMRGAHRWIPLLFAVVGLGALALGGLATGGWLLGRGATVVQEAKLPCGGRPGEVVGYLFGGKHPFFSRALHTTWELTIDREVAADYPHEGNGNRGDLTTVCRLPRGTVITVAQPTIHVRGSGVWVPVVADAIALPEPEAP